MKKFYVGIKAVVTDDSKGILLLGRDYASGNFWDTPGGRIDDDENFEQTLKRELSEELPGITDIKLQKLVGATRIHKDIETDTGLVLVYFSVNAKLPEPINLSDEHNSYKWIDRKSDIPVEINPELARILAAALKN